jgi:hypothetical protein
MKIAILIIVEGVPIRYAAGKIIIWMRRLGERLTIHAQRGLLRFNKKLKMGI